MKKREVSDIISSWKSTYAKKGVSPADTELYVEYAERLISRDLPPIIDLKHLSLLVGIDYLLLVKMVFSSQSFYRDFTIPKRSGGDRQITAPYPSLLFVQRWINKNILTLQKIQFCAHGFVKDHSILTNARQHQNCRQLLKMDIRDFFGSIPQSYVINYFQKELGYFKEVAYLLSCLCCLDGVLPQGAPTSPALSNLISTSLDRRLYRLAKKFNLKYTRYADDIAFSGDSIPSSFILYVKDIITDCHLVVNDSKTRLYNDIGRKIIAGVSLSSGIPRVPKDYRRELRKELHYVEKYGLEGHIRHNKIKKSNYLESLMGKINFWLFIEPWNIYARSMNEMLKKLSQQS